MMGQAETRDGEARRGAGKLVVLSGPSGVGKTTLVNAILDASEYRRVVTCTTRPPREGEEDGRDYHFLTMEEFQRRVDGGRFLEYARVHGELYGTPRDDVEDGLRRGETLLLNIDVQGAATIRAALEADAGPLRGRVVTVFVLPPSLEELRRRLAGRGTEPEEGLEERLRVAQHELEQQQHYDYRIVNDDVSEAARRVLDCVDGESVRPVTRPT